jgi:3-oxoacyl-[acyl-carrier protein] reductase
MDLGLGGKVALVMGSSAGIGLGVAEALAREGARVAVVSRSRGRAEEAAATIAGGDAPTSDDGIAGEAAPFVADATDLERLERLSAEVEAALGPIEILVANTGGPPPGRSLSHELDHWERAYRSLVLAPRVLAKAVVPGMRERGWGRIVNVGSTSTREPIPGLSLSNAHRMAAVGFLKTLAREVAGDGITVNTVATGRFATERLASMAGSLEAAEAAAERDVPAGRLGRPEEYGDLVAFLCSERAAYVTGTVIPIDGGMLHAAF